jgi:hypothetical protein
MTLVVLDGKGAYTFDAGEVCVSNGRQEKLVDSVGHGRLDQNSLAV